MTDAKPLQRTHDRPARTSDGGFMLLVLLGLIVTSVWALITLVSTDNDAFVLPFILLCIGTVLVMIGFYSLQPNEAAALTLFGNYKGTDKKPGLRWVLPWYGRKKVSLRVRNVTSQTLKVNDKRGNPIEIASHFAYDHAEADEPTLRAGAEQVSALLKDKLQERIAVAGLAIDETKLSHLAYAPEIAGAMLRRQQAEAVLAARRFIVQGAVEMVQHALEQLSERGIVQLDDERRAAMVSNLLVVLCGDRDAQPVVNTGTIYP